jgi:hypothetical protein
VLGYAAPNNGMHPTADTLLLIYLNGMGRRVMPGVRLLTSTLEKHTIVVGRREGTLTARAGKLSAEQKGVKTKWVSSMNLSPGSSLG